KEWPGTFEIVDKKGYFWRAAKSVLQKSEDRAVILLHLRGPRPAGDTTELFFRYHLTGAKTMQIVLVNRTAKAKHTVTLKGLEQGRWAEAVVNFNKDGRGDGKPSAPKRDDLIDEIHFLLSPEADLLLDDVLLYAPGK